MRDLVIIGTGGFAREVHAWIDEAFFPDHVDFDDYGGPLRPYRCVGFLDDNADTWGSIVHGLLVIGGSDWLLVHPEADAVLGIGSPAVKARIAKRLDLSPDRWPVVLHPSVWQGPEITFGPGCIVCQNCVLTCDAQLGAFVTLNLAVTFAHDSFIGNYTTVAPGAQLSGNLTCGAGVDVGTGAVTVQGVTIGDWSIVGAGAVVNRDLPPNVTAVGVPAKVIKERPAGWWR